MCRRRKYKNTNTKYTIAVYEKSARETQLVAYGEKRNVQGYQKLYSHVSNEEIQKQNTQMILPCVKCDNTKTNTQIQKHSI